MQIGFELGIACRLRVGGEREAAGARGRLVVVAAESGRPAVPTALLDQVVRLRQHYRTLRFALLLLFRTSTVSVVTVLFFQMTRREPHSVIILFVTAVYLYL